MNPKRYDAYVKKMRPSSPIWKDCFYAFWIGGLICVLGQLIQNNLYGNRLGQNRRKVPPRSMTLVLLFAFCSPVLVFTIIWPKLRAGTLVPITGFANSIAAPAIEFRSEGIVTGTCVKLFSIAGPVLVFGTAASVLYGFIYWLFTQVW